MQYEGSQENIPKQRRLLDGEVQVRRGGCPAPRKEQIVRRRAEACRNHAHPRRQDKHDGTVQGPRNRGGNPLRMDPALWRQGHRRSRMFRKGEEAQEHGTAAQEGREAAEAECRGRIGRYAEGEDQGAGAHRAAAEGGDRIPKKTACLGGEEKRVGNVDRARIVDELRQGRGSAGPVRLSEWLAPSRE